MVIEGGIGFALSADLVSSAAKYIDFVKFGWGTAVVTAGLQAKIDVLTANGIGFYFGGELFWEDVAQGPVDGFKKFLGARACPARAAFHRAVSPFQPGKARLHPQPHR